MHGRSDRPPEAGAVEQQVEQAEREAPGFAFVVRSMTIDFRKPARMDDVLEVITEPQEVLGASVTLRQRVMRGEELLLDPADREHRAAQRDLARHRDVLLHGAREEERGDLVVVPVPGRAARKSRVRVP